MRGTVTRNTFEMKKNNTTGVQARNGGRQSYDARSACNLLERHTPGRWMNSRPPDMNMLINASG